MKNRFLEPSLIATFSIFYMFASSGISWMIAGGGLARQSQVIATGFAMIVALLFFGYGLNNMLNRTVGRGLCLTILISSVISMIFFVGLTYGIITRLPA